MKHWKSNVRLSFRGVLKKLVNKYHRKKIRQKAHVKTKPWLIGEVWSPVKVPT